MRKKTVLTAGIVAAFGLAVMTSSAVFAQSETEGGGVKTIVQKIAQRFNLKESDVQAVFDEEHKSRMAKMSKRYENHLNELVKNGTITDEQKQKILAKKKELEANMQTKLESYRNMTLEERKKSLEEERDSLESWAKENGIDLSKVPFFMKVNGHGPKGGKMFFLKLKN